MTSKNSLTLESSKYVQSRFPDLFLSSPGDDGSQHSKTPMLNADVVLCSSSRARDQSDDKQQGIVPRLLKMIIYSLKLR